MLQLNILYSKEYVGRVLYVLQLPAYTNKVITCYLSSGLSGTGHGGQILPFSALNTSQRLSAPIVGYIYKEMYYNKRWVNHKKRLSEYPAVESLCKQIAEALPKFEMPTEVVIPTPPEIREINYRMDESHKGLEILDLDTLND